jgi:RNA polymerase sigma factor (TIGR02999 family)
LSATALLQAWGRGDQRALDQLAPLVQHELQRLARRHMARERAGHTLQTTALVNEVFVRLIDGKQVEWRNRAHFFAIAARLMRRILVDSARAQRYQKRGAGAPVVSLDDVVTVSPERSVEETAAALDVSPDTVMRDWRLARGWLLRELSREQPHT